MERTRDHAAHLHLAETLSAFVSRLRASAETLDIVERQRIVRRKGPHPRRERRTGRGTRPVGAGVVDELALEQRHPATWRRSSTAPPSRSVRPVRLRADDDGLGLPHRDQSAVEIAALATEYVDGDQMRLSTGVTLTVWQNGAESLNNQLSLMVRNGVAGFALVFLLLALFLDVRLAV